MTRNRKFQKNLKTEQYPIIASFQAKINWKWPRKRKKCKLSFRSVPTRSVIQNSKKIANKFKKLNDTTMASFHVKNRWKAQRKRENKNFHSVPFCFYPTRNRKFQKNSEKTQKTKQYHYGFILSQN